MEKFSELQYNRPDVKKFKKESLEIIKKSKAAKSYEEFKELVLLSDEKNADIETLASIAYIRNTVNTADKFYDDEVMFINKEYAKLMTLSQKSIKASLSSPFRKDFDKEFGPLMNYANEQNLKLLSIKIIPDQIKEGKLTQEYSKTAAACKTDFRGEECNFYGLLKHMQSTDRAERKEAFEAWANLYESVSDKLDEQYDKLVALRVKKAKKLKFKDYIEMSYLARNRYDYTPADVENFRNFVAKIIVPAVDKLYKEQAARLGIDKLHYYDEQLVFPEGNAIPQGTKDEMVGWAKEMYHELSSETGEFFDFMVENELFDLETKPNKHLGGYCTFLPKYKAPFIFSNFNGTSADVDVLTHEAGHAFQGYLASRILPLTAQQGSTSEINEIHSMSMEHFTYPWMDKFFGENADKYRYAHLTEALKTIPYLVAVDEFQHRVFENPTMTAKERRAAWHKIETIYLPWRDYDGNKFLEEGGFWMQKQHIFLYPFYYVDYALAGLCALQFFVMNEANHEDAWGKYLKLCRLGGSLGYFDLLKEAGLENPFKESTIRNVVEKTLEQIDIFKNKL